MMPWADLWGSTILWQSRSAAPAQSSWVSGRACCCCCCSACRSVHREASDEGADFWRPRASEWGRGWQHLCSFQGTLVGKQQRDQFTANTFSLPPPSPGLCFLYPWSRSRPRLQSAGRQTLSLAGVWRPHRSCSRCDAYSFSAAGWNLSPVRQKGTEQNNRTLPKKPPCTFVREQQRGTNLGETAFLVDEGQQGAGSPSQELQDVLVVTELQVSPLHILFQVLLLLQLEDVADEVLLQRLVGKVDAQLLKAAHGGQSARVRAQSRGPDVWGRRNKRPSPVCAKVLKAKDIQQADGQEERFDAFRQTFVDDAVDFPHDPNKQFVVDRLKNPTQEWCRRWPGACLKNSWASPRLRYLDQGVPAAGGLLSAERLDHTVSDGQEGATGQTGGQCRFAHL